MTNAARASPAAITTALRSTGFTAVHARPKPSPRRVPIGPSLSPEPAAQMLVSAFEHSADRPREDRIGYSESRFDPDVVADDAAVGSVQQGAFVPPDAVPPTRRGFTKASPVRQRNQFDAVAVDGKETHPELPQDRRTGLPGVGIEARTVRRVGIAKERRDFLIDATHGRHRRPHILPARSQGALEGQAHTAHTARCAVVLWTSQYNAAARPRRTARRRPPLSASALPSARSAPAATSRP